MSTKPKTTTKRAVRKAIEPIAEAKPRVGAKKGCTMTRWKMSEWKQVIENGLAHFQKDHRLIMETREFLKKGQAILEPKRQRTVISWKVPLEVSIWAAGEHHLEFDSREAQPGCRLLRTVKIPPKEAPPQMEHDEFKNSILKQWPMNKDHEPIEEPVSEIEDREPVREIEAVIINGERYVKEKPLEPRDLTDIYMLLSEIRDLLAPPKESDTRVTEPDVKAAIHEHVERYNTTQPKLPRILLVGFLPRQKEEVARQFAGRAVILNSWHPEESSAGSLPNCDHIVATTRFISHSKFQKAKVEAKRIGAQMHMTPGSVSSLYPIINGILS